MMDLGCLYWFLFLVKLEIFGIEGFGRCLVGYGKGILFREKREEMENSV